jgi:hypothetical protein
MPTSFLPSRKITSSFSAKAQQKHIEQKWAGYHNMLDFKMQKV